MLRKVRKRPTLPMEAGLPAAGYSRAMDNTSSWPSLIATLSGQRVSTPSTWPVREVHRLCDVCVPKTRGTPAGSLIASREVAHGRIASSPSPRPEDLYRRQSDWTA